MQFDRNKLKIVVLYVVSKCAGDKLGAVKLNKVLYYCDMLRYAETGNSITGSTYIKSPFGPTCKELKFALRDMSSEKMIEIQSINYFGYKKTAFIALQKPNLECLSDQELAVVDEIITFVCEENSARTISELSHNRAWESVEFGEEIKYNSVYHIFPVQVSEDALRWASVEVEGVEASRSKSSTVDFELFSALRSRVLATVRQ